jgi:hypothetical protein
MEELHTDSIDGGHEASYGLGHVPGRGRTPTAVRQVRGVIAVVARSHCAREGVFDPVAPGGGRTARGSAAFRMEQVDVLPRAFPR